MILWVHSEGPQAFKTLDDAIEVAQPGDRLIVTGEFLKGFSGVPEGKGPLTIESPDFPADVFLEDAVLIESPTRFVNINFHRKKPDADICAREPDLIDLDGCMVEGYGLPEDPTGGL